MYIGFIGWGQSCHCSYVERIHQSHWTSETLAWMLAAVVAGLDTYTADATEIDALGTVLLSTTEYGGWQEVKNSFGSRPLIICSLGMLCCLLVVFAAMNSWCTERQINLCGEYFSPRTNTFSTLLPVWSQSKPVISQLNILPSAYSLYRIKSKFLN